VGVGGGGGRVVMVEGGEKLGVAEVMASSWESCYFYYKAMFSNVKKKERKTVKVLIQHLKNCKTFAR
jgi:hypothetical protein